LGKKNFGRKASDQVQGCGPSVSAQTQWHSDADDNNGKDPQAEMSNVVPDAHVAQHLSLIWRSGQTL
jgi:hypothetical protein